MTAQAGEELVEVVNSNGDVLSVVSRRLMRRDNLKHRGVFIAVVDSRRRLLVHQRSWDKDVWPGRFDICVGGVVGVGEAWERAAKRELFEEVGLASELRSLGVGEYCDDDVQVVGAVFLARCTDTEVSEVSFVDAEVISATWVDLASIDDSIAAASFVPDSLALVLPLLRSEFGLGSDS